MSRLYGTVTVYLTICPVFWIITIGEKNNTNQNCEATIKFSIEDKWLKYFAQIIYYSSPQCKF